MPRVCRSCCGGTSCGQVCAVVTDCATGAAINTATVALIQGTTTVGTCTSSSGGVGSVTMTSGGSGYFSSFPVTFTGGGGSGAAGTASVNLLTHAVTGVTITSPGSGYTSAPTPDFSAGGGSGAAGTASLGGTCCIGFSAGSSSTKVQVSAPGYVTQTSSTFTTACGSNSFQSFILVPVNVTLCVVVNGCPSVDSSCNVSSTPYPGASVVIQQAGVTVASGTTDSTGTFCWPSASEGVTYTATVTEPTGRFASMTQTFPLTYCVNQTLTFNLAPAPGYTCTIWGGYANCLLPVATTLRFADSIFGTGTATFGTYPNPGGGGNISAWLGSITNVTLPGCSFCSGQTYTLDYYLVIQDAGTACGITCFVYINTNPTFCSSNFNVGSTLASLTCPTAFTAVFDMNTTFLDISGNRENSPWCAAGGTVTWTE
jgi:hypothetical protein